MTHLLHPIFYFLVIISFCHFSPRHLHLQVGFRFFQDQNAKNDELGGSRMEQTSIWKNFLLLIVGSLLALHINVVSAADSTSSATSSDSDKTEGCSLEE